MVLQFTADTAEEDARILDCFPRDSNRNVLVFYHVVIGADGFCQQHIIVFLTEAVEPILLIGYQDRASKIGDVQPAVADCDLGCGAGIKTVEQRAVAHEHIHLILFRCDRVVNIRNLPALAELTADLKDTIRPDLIDRDHLLSGPRHCEALLVLAHNLLKKSHCAYRFLSYVLLLVRTGSQICISADLASEPLI